MYYFYFSLGADVIYDPVCLPHLVRVVTILLSRKASRSCTQNSSCEGLSPNSELHDTNGHNCNDLSDRTDGREKTIGNGGSDDDGGAKKAPVAYIACVVRNVDTFNYFLSLVEESKLDVRDLSDTLKLVNLLPYMRSYNQATIRLLRITYMQSYN